MKIAICGLIKSSNLGEQFIAKSLSWIIVDELRRIGYKDNVEFVEVDIQATNDVTKEYDNIVQNRIHNLFGYTYRGIPVDIIHYELKNVADKLRSQSAKNTIYRLRHFMWIHSKNLGRRYSKYFELKFKQVDMIIVDGAGLLEYSYNAYQEALALISRYADVHNIPVIFNAIGRAGEFNKNDFRCQVLMNAFRYDCVRYVSARDSRESVQECVGNRFNVKLLADAAFYVDEAFKVKAMSRGNTIGIGLIRGDAVLSYADGFGKQDWIELFADIARVLKSNGYQYEFFTNGMRQDYDIGLKVVEKLKDEREKLVTRPTDAKTLLNTISSYKAIITCRMHSSIAAFSMGIPSVILSWNDKVDKYMEIVGYPERSIKQSEFNADLIVDRMKMALCEGISTEKQNKMKELARESVRGFLMQILNLYN